MLVNDIIGERVTETVALIESQGGKAIGAVADISNEADVNAFVESAIKQWGKIDILCNNAGIMDKINMPANTPTELWNRVIEVNVTGYFLRHPRGASAYAGAQIGVDHQYRIGPPASAAARPGWPMSPPSTPSSGLPAVSRGCMPVTA